MGKRRELLEKAERLIKSYNPKRTTLESHANEYLAETKLDAEAAFLKEVFYGVMRCKAALKVFMACFFNDMSARVLRSDYTMYMILAYLTVFRLEELTISEFRKFVFSIDADKMTNFLEYVFSASTLENSGVVAHWAKIFDPFYVRDTLLKKLALASPAIQMIINDLHDKSMGLAAAKQASEESRRISGADLCARTTMPPSLTAPGPRHVPEPQAITHVSTSRKSHQKPNFNKKAPHSNNDTYQPPLSRGGDRTKRTSVQVELRHTRSTLRLAQAALAGLRADDLDFSKSKGSKGSHKLNVCPRSGHNYTFN